MEWGKRPPSARSNSAKIASEPGWARAGWRAEGGCPSHQDKGTAGQTWKAASSGPSHEFCWDLVSKGASSELLAAHSWRVQEAEERARLFTEDGLKEAGGSRRQTAAGVSVLGNPSQSVRSTENWDLEANAGLWARSAGRGLPAGQRGPRAHPHLSGLLSKPEHLKLQNRGQEAFGVCCCLVLVFGSLWVSWHLSCRNTKHLLFESQLSAPLKIGPFM